MAEEAKEVMMMGFEWCQGPNPWMSYRCSHCSQPAVWAITVLPKVYVPIRDSQRKAITIHWANIPTSAHRVGHDDDIYKYTGRVFPIESPV
jgi:hypothetical protein